jgi:Gamma-glutamyltransferase
LIRRIVFAALIVVASGGVALRGQDPDGGAGRGRPLVAHRPSVPGIHGLVTAGHPLAAMAGLQILMKGGNAIDAAVAVGAALNMMEPQMNGIGGNGFMTVYDKKSGHVYSLAMAGAAPRAMKAADMTPDTLDWGVTAGIVPGNLGGYVTALERFGTMSLAEVFASGIDYAEHGYPIDPSLAAAISRAKNKLEAFPTTAKVFLPNGRAPERANCSAIPISRRRCAKSSRPSRARSNRRKRARRRSKPRSTASTRATSRRSSTASSGRTTA